ncbi:hypothetical protein J6590_050311 [Homalodisca vitripennis]|nr:hypothetical protein J6590_050311 [Homalodisca vitripennis]
MAPLRITLKLPEMRTAVAKVLVASEAAFDPSIALPRVSGCNDRLSTIFKSLRCELKRGYVKNTCPTSNTGTGRTLCGNQFTCTSPNANSSNNDSDMPTPSTSSNSPKKSSSYKKLKGSKLPVVRKETQAGRTFSAVMNMAAPTKKPNLHNKLILRAATGVCDASLRNAATETEMWLLRSMEPEKSGDTH